MAEKGDQRPFLFKMRGGNMLFESLDTLSESTEDSNKFYQLCFARSDSLSDQGDVTGSNNCSSSGDAD